MVSAKNLEEGIKGLVDLNEMSDLDILFALSVILLIVVCTITLIRSGNVKKMLIFCATYIFIMGVLAYINQDRIFDSIRKQKDAKESERVERERLYWSEYQNN